MVRFETQIEIAAPATLTWTAVTSVGRWPTWTASVKSVDFQSGGDLELGSQVRIKQPGLPATTWAVTAFDPGKSFVWKASLPGVVTVAEHQVEAANEGRSRLKLVIEHHGRLARPAGWLLGWRTKRFLLLEARGMKAFAESLRVNKAS